MQDPQLRLYGDQSCFPMNNPAHQVISSCYKPWWRRPTRWPRKSWLGQIDQTCHEELEMGWGPVWRLAMRNSLTGSKWWIRQCTPTGVSAIDWLIDLYTFDKIALSFPKCRPVLPRIRITCLSDGDYNVDREHKPISVYPAIARNDMKGNS